MDAGRFDQFARDWSTTGTRRGLLRFLAVVPLAGLLAALPEDESEAGRRRRKARNGRHVGKNTLRNQRKGKGKKGNGKGQKDKDKGRTKDLPCVNAGQTPRNGRRCCAGLVEDGSGRCIQPVSPPPPPPITSAGCAETCAGCCAGETCVTATTNTICGNDGAACAPCTHPQTCGGGAVPSVCGCTPSTTCPAGQTCGTASNGCGDVIPCGNCSGHDTCGGGGTPGVCGCTPLETCPSPLNCDLIDRGCGAGTIDCGGCTSPNTCGGGTPSQANVCGCTPATSCPGGQICGTALNGCGTGTIPCGDCSNPTPICDGTTCVPCSTERPCPSGSHCQGGECIACTVCADGCPFQSVQSAVASATPGSTIYICPGTYEEMITITKSLTLIGAGSGEGAGGTTLDAKRGGRVVTITIGELGAPGDSVGLRGIRITGGLVAGGFGDGDGGGIFNDVSDLTMTDCVVANNRASRGGGIFNVEGPITMTDCFVLDNIASGNGGGIYNELATIELNSSSVTGNSSGNPGGGGGILNQGTLKLFNSSVTANTAAGSPNNCSGTAPEEGACG